ncbi:MULTISPECIES: DUF6600 domain-containing protein [unclassified Mesorhizobium]|uniref:DUF6600 domain-containing protein n=1 Tax=unclassified Mesorhizobium TaxID=325217 RepID=UPI0030148B56
MALIGALIGVSVAPLTSPGNQVVQAATFSVSTHERLSRYGEWRMSSRFGQVWVPTVQTGWRPYTVGHWVWTDDGWYWQSDEPFGWVVFHYGRWAFDRDLGWVWVSGNDWAPAWVVWRESDENVGWVPAPPPTVVVEDDWWSFAPVAAIGAVAILPLLRPVSDNVTYVRNTTIINENITVNNYRRAGTVRVGNTVVPVNAGPPLSRLPSTVVKSVRAAKVVPPSSGSIAAAHLDPSKGAVIKTSAAKLNPGAQPPVLAKSNSASVPASSTAAQQPANSSAGPKKPVGATVSAQNRKKVPTATTKPAAIAGVPAGPSVLKTPQHPVKVVNAAASKPAAVNRHVTTAGVTSQQLLLQRRAALQQRRKVASAQQQARQAAKHQQAMAMHERPMVHAQAQAMAGHGMAPAQARRVAKCNPHDPRCKRPG